ncbi:MAG: hypothetical protein ACRC62_12350 [Microcoleus sp.]
MDNLDIAIAARRSYSDALNQPGVGHLIINELGLILWMDQICCDLFQVEIARIENNSLNRFLPESMQGAMHDRLVAGVFSGFKEAIKSGNPMIGLQSMGKTKDGESRTIKAYNALRQPIEFTLEFAPLTVGDNLYAIALIAVGEAYSVGILKESVSAGADLVIKNSRVQIVADAGQVVGTQFSGVFGFFVNQIFGKSRGGRIASGICTFATFGFIAYTLYLFFDSRFGTKPLHQNYNLGEPQPEYAAPSDPNPGLQSTPKPRPTNLPRGES